MTPAQLSEIVAEITRLEGQGRLAEACERAAEAAARAGGAVASVLWARASELAIATAGTARARELAERARRDAGDDAAARCEALLAGARVELRVHTDPALAAGETMLAEAETLARFVSDTSDRPGVGERLRATARKLRALALARRGNASAALAAFHEAYALAEGWPAVRARVLLAWALNLRNWGLFDEAARMCERSLDLRLQLGDLAGAAICHGVLGFIYQRQGDHVRERDALVADLRLSERIGASADLPSLHVRLAGALVNLGKYAGAWDEAERAIALEDARPRTAGADAALTRTHGFAWREQARVCGVQGRFADGLALAEQARQTFEQVGDAWGAALSRITTAELHLAAASQPGLERGALEAERAAAEAALAAARPTFVKLGAVPEAAETMLLGAHLAALSGEPDEAAELIACQVLPVLEQCGLTGALYRRAQAALDELAPERARDRAVLRAATMRGAAAVVAESAAQLGSIVAARVLDAAAASRFARAAIERGAIVVWPTMRYGAAVMLGPEHVARALALAAAVADLGVVVEHGEVDLEHPWPAPVRVRSAALDAAVARAEAPPL